MAGNKNETKLRETLQTVYDWLLNRLGTSFPSGLTGEGLLNIVGKTLSETESGQECITLPKDLNGNGIEIGDSVRMLKTFPFGDREWEDTVISMEFVGKGQGDLWIIHGEKGSAWACETETIEGNDNG